MTPSLLAIALDGVILLILFLFILNGWRSGFLSQSAGLLSYGISVVVGMMYQHEVGILISASTGLPERWSIALALILLTLGIDWILSTLFSFLLFLLPVTIVSSKINRITGAMLAFVKAMAIAILISVLLTSVPLRGQIQAFVTTSNAIWSFSEIGKFLFPVYVQYLEKTVRNVTTITSRESGDSQTLPIENTIPYVVSELNEKQIMDEINKERKKIGVEELELDTNLRILARSYSEAMFKQSFFSHTNPMGETVVDRAAHLGIMYRVIGENLAFGPDVPTIHAGLMNSQSHRKNILDPAFHKVGIGVIDTNGYGMVVTEEFSD